MHFCIYYICKLTVFASNCINNFSIKKGPFTVIEFTVDWPHFRQSVCINLVYLLRALNLSRDVKQRSSTQSLFVNIYMYRIYLIFVGFKREHIVYKQSQLEDLLTAPWAPNKLHIFCHSTAIQDRHQFNHHRVLHAQAPKRI